MKNDTWKKLREKRIAEKKAKHEVKRKKRRAYLKLHGYIGN